MPHAILSPSGAPKWMTCPGSAAMEQGMPNPSSKYADEGTAAHFLAACWLNENGNARNYFGKTIQIFEDDVCGWKDVIGDPSTYNIKLRSEWKVTEDMLHHIQKYVDNVKNYVFEHDSPVALMYVEDRLPLTKITGEKDAYGTADLVVFSGDELQIHDLKYGQGVDVDAENNYQLMIYAAGALDKYKDTYTIPIKSIRLVIHQPRKNNFPEWSMPIRELIRAKSSIYSAATNCWDILDRVEEDKSKISEEDLEVGPHCRNAFCRARSICPALTGKVLEATAADFEDLTKKEMPLHEKMKLIPIVEDWCKAVRAQVEAKLFTGEDVPGFKLVQGRKGNRAWDDKDGIEKEMLAMRITHKYIYDYKLASPATLEKHAKNNHINKKQWERLQEHITQSEGVPSVAPSDDKRPAISVNPGDDFDDISVTGNLEGLI